MLTLTERLRSAHYGLWLRVSEGLGRARGPRPEQPVQSLAAAALPPATQRRVARLAARYGVAFETCYGAATALENYARLELLDRSLAAFAVPPPLGRSVHDVGCASFWYAAALHAAFRPATLSGYDLEGYRRLHGGVNRAERALGYARALPNTEFLIADYASVVRPAGLVTAFFPFVTATPVLAWRLPLTVLQPERLLARIRANLEPDGEFWMVNHGEREAAIAWPLAAAAGLLRQADYLDREPLLPRAEPAVVSRWTPQAR
jgi:hypothetical protein